MTQKILIIGFLAILFFCITILFSKNKDRDKKFYRDGSYFFFGLAMIFCIAIVKYSFKQYKQFFRFFFETYKSISHHNYTARDLDWTTWIGGTILTLLVLFGFTLFIFFIVKFSWNKLKPKKQLNPARR
jgi:TRAP-type C4-dicarboxylate transport system permease small subunit